MNTQRRARVRGFPKLVVRLLAAVASIMGFGGFDCTGAFQVVQHIPLNVSVVAAATGLDEASRGELSMNGLVTVTTPLQAQPPDNLASHQVTISVEDEDGRSFGRFPNYYSPHLIPSTFPVGIDPNALPTLRPLVISVEHRKHYEGVLKKIESGSAMLFLRSADGVAAPRLTSVVAVGSSGAEPGVPVEVEFTGVNFDSTATFSTRRGLTLTNPQGAGPGKVRATLTLPLDAETGQLSFFVQAAGARSNYARLTVSALRPAPQLTGFFPNYATAGGRVSIQAVGTGFVAGAMVIPEAGSTVPLVGDTAVLSSNLLQQEVFPTSASGQQFLLVDSMGRPSLSKAFHCEAPTFAGPRIRSIRPSTLVGGALNQVEITWENVTSATAPSLIGAPSAEFAQTLLAGSAVLPVSERPASARSIAVLDVPQTPVSVPVHIAARTASGHHTNLYGVNIVPPNPAKPFISRALIGRAPRGAEVIDTVVGERLSTAFRIQFYPPKFDAEIIGNPTSTSLQMRVTPRADASLAGDTLTFFTVETNQGVSNRVSFLVDPSGGPGGAPRLDLLAPNWAYVGTMSSAWMNGANFDANSVVEFTPAASVTVDPTVRRFIDAHNFEQPFFSNTLGAVNARVKTPGVGESEVMSMTLLDPNGPQGPLVNGVQPLSIVVGGRSQIKVYGHFLDVGGAPTVIGMRTAALGTSIALGIYYPNVNGLDTHAGVIELRTLDAPPTLPASGGLTYFTLERPDGLNTYPSALNAKPAPATGPIVTQVTTSSGQDIRRGQTRVMRVFGRRLTGVTAFAIGATGVNLPATPNPINVIDDTEVQVTFVVDADAMPTGDQITTLQALHMNGAASNEASFIILP